MYLKKGSLRSCFLCGLRVWARQLSFTLNRELARISWAKCLCLPNAWVSLFKLCRENMNDVFGFLNSSSGLGEDPYPFWGMTPWHKQMTLSSMINQMFNVPRPTDPQWFHVKVLSLISFVSSTQLTLRPHYNLMKDLTNHWYPSFH